MDYDDYKGKTAIGRVLSGRISKNMDVVVCSDISEECKLGKVSYLFTYS